MLTRARTFLTGAVAAAFLFGTAATAQAGTESVTIEPGQSAACAFANNDVAALGSPRVHKRVADAVTRQAQTLCSHAAADPNDSGYALPSSWRNIMLREINATRAVNKLKPLRLCAPLNTAAQDYSQVMASTGHFDHTGPDGSSPGDRIARTNYASGGWAENIAMGQYTVEHAVMGWIKSDGHYANIMNPSYRYVGFGAAPVGDGGFAWTQNFGIAKCTTKAPRR